MDTFTRRSLEALVAHFDAGAEKFPELRHAATIGANPYLGVGGDVAGWAAPDPKSNPQFFAFRLIGEGLATRGQVKGHVHSHDCVLVRSADPDAFNGYFFARSVIFAASSDRVESGFDRYEMLARESYQLLATLDESSVPTWGRLGNLPARGFLECHYWTVGLVLWAETSTVATVPIDHGTVTMSGGPLFIMSDAGEEEPLMGQRENEPPSQVALPLQLSFGAGLRIIDLPDEEKPRELLLAMCDDCRTVAIRHGVFSASASALRWILALDSDSNTRPAGSLRASGQSADGNANCQPVTWPHVNAQLPQPLSREQRRCLYEAVLATFDRPSLERLLLLQLDVRLEQIASPGPLNDTVFAVLMWLEGNGRTGEFVGALAVEKPNHRLVREAVAECRKSD